MRLALGLAAAISTVAGDAHAQAWRYERSRDPLTDATVYRASQTLRTHSMNVRCKNDHLEVYLVIPGYLGDGADVRYRFDQGELRTNSWDTSTDGTGVFAPGPGEFARSLMTASVLHFEVTGEHGSPDLVRIPLTGSAAAIGPVLDGCGVPRSEIYTPGGPIWRRAVEAIDAAPRDLVEAVAGALTRLELYTGPVDRVRRRELYAALSNFYSAYWSGCNAGRSLSASCETWTAAKRYNPDADYPKEPIELLVEFMSSPAPSAAADTGEGQEATEIAWARRPIGEVPERASQRGIMTGTVSLSCRAEPTGALTSCNVVKESPTGAGFAQEALRAARSARLSPRTVDARQGQMISFDVEFSPAS